MADLTRDESKIIDAFDRAKNGLIDLGGWSESEINTISESVDAIKNFIHLRSITRENESLYPSPSPAETPSIEPEEISPVLPDSNGVDTLTPSEFK